MGPWLHRRINSAPEGGAAHCRRQGAESTPRSHIRPGKGRAIKSKASLLVTYLGLLQFEDCSEGSLGVTYVKSSDSLAPFQSIHTSGVPFISLENIRQGNNTLAPAPSATAWFKFKSQVGPGRFLND